MLRSIPAHFPCARFYFSRAYGNNQQNDAGQPNHIAFANVYVLAEQEIEDNPGARPSPTNPNRTMRASRSCFFEGARNRAAKTLGSSGRWQGRRTQKHWVWKR